MTYFLLDRDGYICDIGTSLGLKEIVEMVPSLDDGQLHSDEEKTALAEALDQLGRQEDANKVRDAVLPLTVTDGVVDEGDVQTDSVDEIWTGDDELEEDKEDTEEN